MQFFARILFLVTAALMVSAAPVPESSGETNQMQHALLISFVSNTYQTSAGCWFFGAKGRGGGCNIIREIEGPSA